MIKVCHVTNVHPTEDVRIFQKECISLAKAGYDVTLVQQGESYEKDGVHVIGFGAPASSRLKRMLFTSRRAYKKALAVDAGVYHLHDPELIPFGMKLKRKGKTVIFDSHEDVPSSILIREWLPAPLRKLAAWAYEHYEAFCVPRLDGVVAAAPAVYRRLEKRGGRGVVIANYPVLVEGLPTPAFQNRKVVFAGLLSEIWNIHILLRAVDPIEGAAVELRARQVEEPYGTTLRSLPGWKKVNFPGRVSHAEVLRLYSECSCGAALLVKDAGVGGDVGNLGNTKMFEYMMAGLPFVCSDAILWKEIVERWQCGVCVDPENVEEISSAIRYLLDHPEEARRMGENGRRAVREAYNWGLEEKKLLALYRDILDGGNG